MIDVSLMSVDLRGPWHKECGYLPCRVFKNNSYGRITGTNSENVKKIFGDYVVYDENPNSLFDKLMYNENLYEYISNYSTEPNIDLIKTLLKVVCIDHLYSGDVDIEVEVEKMSGGEQMRMTLAQTLYNILSKKYEIILFDEIDVNLDFNTASKIFNNILQICKDKICFFIVHNEDLKQIFQKVITFQNHQMIPNF
jgi:ABC-type multidrug transport system ATPase subunit